MSPSALCAWAVIGLVSGWLFHRVVYGGPRFAPMVSWGQPLALVLVAAILLGTAWSTRRSIRQWHGALSPHHAVNRLVLARACAYVGSLMAGAYFGYAVSWLGVDSDLQTQRLITSAIAGVSGLLVVAAGLILERACRVPPEDDAP
jgi:F0F1-type ATP synthase membrane subunit c/vacuolar-type H+-ATPase subunit K